MSFTKLTRKAGSVEFEKGAELFKGAVLEEVIQNGSGYYKGVVVWDAEKNRFDFLDTMVDGYPVAEATVDASPELQAKYRKHLNKN